VLDADGREGGATGFSGRPLSLCRHRSAALSLARGYLTPRPAAIAPRPGLPPWAGLLLCTASVRPSVAGRTNLVLFSRPLFGRV